MLLTLKIIAGIVFYKVSVKNILVVFCLMVKSIIDFNVAAEVALIFSDTKKCVLIAILLSTTNNSCDCRIKNSEVTTEINLFCCSSFFNESLLNCTIALWFSKQLNHGYLKKYINTTKVHVIHLFPQNKGLESWNDLWAPLSVLCKSFWAVLLTGSLSSLRSCVFPLRWMWWLQEICALISHQHSLIGETREIMIRAWEEMISLEAAHPSHADRIFLPPHLRWLEKSRRPCQKLRISTLIHWGECVFQSVICAWVYFDGVCVCCSAACLLECNFANVAAVIKEVLIFFLVRRIRVTVKKLFLLLFFNEVKLRY